MAQESIGHIKLVWNCPSCGTQNPGPHKFCTTCGAPQPENVQFEAPAQQELITDEVELARAKAGPDIHCPFCGTRNPADAQFCLQCGGDLEGGTQRETGRVVAAFRDAPVPEVTCPTCGAKNPASALTCAGCGSSLKADPVRPAAAPARPKGRFNPLILLPVLLVVIGLCGMIFWAFTRKESSSGVVEDVHWTRSVVIEEFGPVKREAWRDDIPSGAQILSCEKRFHHEQDTATADAEQVCGTEYVVDTGDGYGEVVRDCVYRVYLDFCDYQVEDWSVGETVSLEGADYAPVWPQPALGNTQRLGELTEVYTIVFESDNQTYTYTTADEALYSQFEVGSEWTLTINPTFNSIISVEPLN